MVTMTGRFALVMFPQSDGPGTRIPSVGTSLQAGEAGFQRACVRGDEAYQESRLIQCWSWPSGSLRTLQTLGARS